MYQEKINAYFDNPAREEELIAAISRLVRIPSVREPAQPGMPFGPGPAKALAEAITLAEELGFATENFENYVGTADLCSEDTVLHILGHLDVVGAGTGWTVTAPYTPKLVDGLLYGRGTDDDKGPVVAALFAMKAVRDLGIPLRHNAKLIMGTDEESGSEDIAYYYAKHPYAPCTFSPDSEFPVTNIEKGGYKPTFTKTWPESCALPRVQCLHGGFRINVLPPEADAVVAGMTPAQLAPYCRKAEQATGAVFTATAREDGTAMLHAAGTGAHASTPEEGNNAITALLTLLQALPLAESESKTAMHALARLFPHGDSAGKALGIAQEDAISGPLTLAFSLLEVNETGFTARFDSRAPICANEENCKNRAEAALKACGMAVSGEMHAPHHTPADAPFVKTLLRCYEQYSGEKGACIAIGGGTYVHDIPGGVAFGCGMPGFQSNLHGANERLCIKTLLMACKIFTQVILDLCA